MSGRLPIDRIQAQDAPAIYDEHREPFAEKQAALEAMGHRDGATPPAPDDERQPADEPSGTPERTEERA